MIMRLFCIFTLLVSGLFLSPYAKADIRDYHLDVAQLEGDDTYDPFADYSEFEESSEEEADINFFRNGRFFTVGFIGGMRFPTSTLGDLYSNAPTFGLFLSYFFDLRFALQIHFLTGDHKIDYTSKQGTKISGNAGITSIGLNLKYYINTQNVTRGLAQLNPYIVGGFSQVYRTATVADQEAFSKEGAMGFDIGAGFEIPMMRNKMYFGGQLAYQLVTFKNENTELKLTNGTESTGVYPTGDFITALMILGVNF